MRARVTLAVGLPYQIDRVTLAVGLSFCVHKQRLAGLPYQVGQVFRLLVNVKQTRVVTILKQNK